MKVTLLIGAFIRRHALSSTTKSQGCLISLRLAGASVTFHRLDRGSDLASNELPQTFGSEFRSDVPLRCSQHFESNHKFADGGGAQQGRIVVRVKMPFRIDRKS